MKARERDRTPITTAPSQARRETTLTPKRPASDLRLAWLDWVRFIAAAMVVVGHVRDRFVVAYGVLPEGQKGPLTAMAYLLSRFGNEAVVVFFVLSGFLVAGRGCERLLAGSFSISDYAIDRVTRIYVPYVPALLVTWACALVVGTPATLDMFLANLFGLQGVLSPNFGANGPLWSLAYEIWFYAILGSAAGCLAFSGNRPIGYFLSALLLLAGMAVFTCLDHSYLMCWVIGAVAYFHRPVRRSLPTLVGGICLCAIGAIANQLGTESVSVDVASLRSCIPSQAIARLLLAAGAACAVSYLVTTTPTGTLAMRLDRIGSRLASFSYTLFLTHYPVLLVIEATLFPKQDRLSLQLAIACGTAIGVAVAVALLLYWLFEYRTAAARRLCRRMVSARISRGS